MISAIIPVYHNEHTLMKNLDSLFFIHKITEIVCVFDGYKPSSSTRERLGACDTKILTISPDIPWGNAKARNRGAYEADNDYLLFLDVDHTLEDQIDELLIPDTVYKFKRVLDKTVWHPNCMMMDRELFFSVGGYDERFCGNYGYEDRYLDHKLQKSDCDFVNLEQEIKVLADGGVNLVRNISVNKSLFYKLIHE